MANKKLTTSYRGAQVLDNVTNDGTDSTVYSDPFSTAGASTWAAQLLVTETTATYAGAVTLWATCKPNPSLTDDTDWVEMVSANGWEGFPTITDTALADGDHDLVDVGVSGALFYRFKVVRSTGAATLDCWVSVKDSK